MLEEAYRALRSGGAVMIYDASDREGEVDLAFHASLITPGKIALLRSMAGGLICFSTTDHVRRVLGLPFMNELLEKYPGLRALASKRLGYGDPPAFTIWVNHISSVTGIRDPDRALTAKRLEEIVGMIYSGREEEARKAFHEEFMAPGHLPILASRGLRRRKGHTELTVALAMLAGLTPAIVFAEMLVEGGVLSLDKARLLSREKGIPLTTGREIMEEAFRMGVGL